MREAGDRGGGGALAPADLLQLQSRRRERVLHDELPIGAEHPQVGLGLWLLIKEVVNAPLELEHVCDGLGGSGSRARGLRTERSK